MLHCFRSRTIEVIDCIEHRQHNFKTPQPGRVRRILDNRNQTKLIALARNSGVPLGKSENLCFREHGEDSILIIVNNIVDTCDNPLRIIVFADNERIPWIKSVEIERYSVEHVLFLYDVAVTNAADHLPLDQFLVLGFLADQTHCIVQF